MDETGQQKKLLLHILEQINNMEVKKYMILATKLNYDQCVLMGAEMIWSYELNFCIRECYVKKEMYHLIDQGLLKGVNRRIMFLAGIQQSEDTFRQCSQSVSLTSHFSLQFHPSRETVYVGFKSLCSFNRKQSA